MNFIKNSHASKALRGLGFALAVQSVPAAAADQNLLPNGDFNSTHRIVGWTDVGTGSGAFDPNLDASGNGASGSMNVFESTMRSTCFRVSPGATYAFGGKAAGQVAFAAYPDGTMTCSAYTGTQCTGTAQPLGSLDMPSKERSFTAYSAPTSQLPPDAGSVQCDVSARTVIWESPIGVSEWFDDLFFTSAAPALLPVTIDGYMSGNWYNPGQSGHGFQLEFTDQAQTLLAIWFTYAPSGGAQKWIFAQGPYDLTKASVTVPAQLLDAPAFPPQFDPGTVTRTPWGTLTFTFTDCDHGSVSWNSTVPGYGSGSMPISRLTRIAGTSCPQ
jgi:hypothetical protein